MEKVIAKTPPMGWNSWDCYGTSVTEEEVRGNAEYMAKHLKQFGWEYIIVDIEWFEPNNKNSWYNKFTELEMDEYSRLIPAVNKFPSSSNGRGFKPLADYIHSLGLKFGIHIMRGVPRQAAHKNTAILGTNKTARNIAHSNSICSWNSDMYGIDTKEEGAENYYNSIFELYASWGVDFVKVDDILRPYHEDENKLVYNAIKKSGRDMVLSLSPGAAPIERSWHLKKYANMWRMTDDFWDTWAQLYAEFERCEVWSAHQGEGHWADCDMLPLGRIELRTDDLGSSARWTRFTKDEQKTMMSLWCMFRSPLMFGGDLRENDEWTLSLITNANALRILNNSNSNRQIYRDKDKAIWFANDNENGHYVALFNTSEDETIISVKTEELCLSGKYMIKDLWIDEELGVIQDEISLEVNAHGVRLLFCKAMN